MHPRRLLVPALVPAAFLAGTFVSTGHTQQVQPAPTVVEVNYMKVEPAKEADYLRLERETWKPIHQERIRRGALRSWTLYQVRYPHGTGTEYDYVTVNTYNSIVDADRQQLAELVAKVHPNVPLQDLVNRTYGGRQLVRGEVWYRIDHVE
jgi:hypothetical protein